MKKQIFILALTLSSGYFLISCKEQAKEATPTVETVLQEEVVEAKKEALALTFASAGYAERAQGADWVKVNIKESGEHTVHILVTSREDIKKPTCSLETEATKINETTYQATLQEVKVNFVVTDNQLTIDTANEGDRGVLSYYCSGGGSLAGSYTAIE